MTLSCLVAVQAATGEPLSVAIFPLIDCQNACASWTGSCGAKSDSEPVPGANEHIWTFSDDKAIGALAFVVKNLIQRDLQLVPVQLPCDGRMLLVEQETGQLAPALVFENARGELFQRLIALAEEGMCGILDRINSERRGAERLALSERVEDVPWPLVAPHLWNEERIAAPHVPLAPLLKVAQIDVWAQQIDMRRACEPDIERVG